MMTGAALAILLVVISILIFCSALFSGLETALFSLKPYQLRRLEEHRAVSASSFIFSRKIRAGF
jgi:Putative Mg2+ and Co2+ transporter CorB